MVTHCGEDHGAVVTRLGNVEGRLGGLEGEFRAHTANGASGHVSRPEMDALKARTQENEDQITDIRTMLVKAGLGMLVAASAGSSLAPTIKAFVMGHFGGQ